MDAAGILAAVRSHAAASGLFDRVAGHEPKNAPGNGLSSASWVQSLAPLPQASGLNITTGYLVLRERLYNPMLQEPQDDIDPNLLAATDTMMGLYSNDFTLGGLVRNVDLLGAHGIPLRADAGYLEQAGKMFRAYDITLPLVCNDLWTQSG